MADSTQTTVEEKHSEWLRDGGPDPHHPDYKKTPIRLEDVEYLLYDGIAPALDEVDRATQAMRVMYQTGKRPGVTKATGKEMADIGKRLRELFHEIEAKYHEAIDAEEAK